MNTEKHKLFKSLIDILKNKTITEKKRAQMFLNIKLTMGEDFLKKIKNAVETETEFNENETSSSKDLESIENNSNNSNSWDSDSSVEFVGEEIKGINKKLKRKNINSLLFQKINEKKKSAQRKELQQKLAVCTIIDTVELLSEDDDIAEMPLHNLCVEEDSKKEDLHKDKVIIDTNLGFKDIKLYMDVSVTNHFFGRNQETPDTTIPQKNPDIRKFFQKASKNLISTGKIFEKVKDDKNSIGSINQLDGNAFLPEEIPKQVKSPILLPEVRVLNVQEINKNYSDKLNKQFSKQLNDEEIDFSEQFSKTKSFCERNVPPIFCPCKYESIYNIFNNEFVEFYL